MRRRLRIACNWGGTVVTVLLLGMWVGSVWCGCMVYHMPVIVGSIERGAISVEYFGPGPIPWHDLYWSGLFFHDAGFVLGFDWEFDVSDSPTHWRFVLPLWTLVLLFAVPTGWSWRRRWAPNICRECGYDLREAVHAVCPECGSGIAARQVSP